MSVLEAQIDLVRFPTNLNNDFSAAISSLNDYTTGEPTDADIDTLAADFLYQLQWHLDEG